MLSLHEDLMNDFEGENLDVYEKILLEYNIGDKRLNERAKKIFALFEKNPGQSILQTAKEWSEAKAIYRFLGNKKVEVNTLISPHIELTAEKIKKKDIIFSIQDTSSIDYSSRNAIEGIGTQGNDSAEGFMLHPTLAVTVQGTPLGLIDFQCWTRPIDEEKPSLTKKEKKAAIRKKPIEEKESFKWIQSFRATFEMQKQAENKTHFVCIADREADFYEFFWEREKHLKQEGFSPDILIRAHHDRNIVSETNELKSLWEYANMQSISSEIDIHVPRKKNKKARIAHLSVRYCKFTISPPKDFDKTIYEPVTVYAVYTDEIEPPEGEEAITWMLLTTIPVLNSDDAIEKIDWYLKRWVIETFFKVLKSGCKTEARQLRSADGLIKVIAIDTIIAWKILFLTFMGREFPDLPASVLFEDFEWKALHVLTFKTQNTPKETPTLKTVILQIAKLGGFMNRKADRFPGPIIMFKGMQVLTSAIPMYLIYNPTYG